MLRGPSRDFKTAVFKYSSDSTLEVDNARRNAEKCVELDPVDRSEISPLVARTGGSFSDRSDCCSDLSPQR